MEHELFPQSKTCFMVPVKKGKLGGYSDSNKPIYSKPINHSTDVFVASRLSSRTYPGVERTAWASKKIRETDISLLIATS